VFAGCGGEETAEGPPAREEPFAMRAFTAAGPAACYGPHRDGQAPGQTDPTAAQIREDLAIIDPHWDLIRIYSSTGFGPVVLEQIRQGGFDIKVVLGVWIAAQDQEGGPEANEAEVGSAIELANQYQDIVVAVSVGNETQVYWSAHRSSEQKLVEYLRRVRAGVRQPVTTADDYNFWNKPGSRLVAGEIDFILMHIHPLWNGLQLEDAVAWQAEQLAEVQALHPDHLVVIGETGWATMVHDEGEQARLIKGAFGEEEQKVFFDESTAWADSAGVLMFTFEVFDEKWKGGPHPDEVEKHWGLYRSDRTPKAAMAGR
jgi:exo-beta-1,3-glucanase (GH17 family)